MTTPPSDTNRQPALVEKLAFNVRETAAKIGVCEETVRRLAKRGKLKPVSGLRHRIFSGYEIDRFLKK